MSYMATGSLTEMENQSEAATVCQSWLTWLTAVCVMLFSLMHGQRNHLPDYQKRNARA
jgi:ferrous iron transport protein B